MSKPMLKFLLNPGFGALSGVLLLAAAASAASAKTLEGLWLTEREGVAIKIATCDDDLCGRIAWVEKARDKSGALRRDRHNPDPEKQTNRVCGLVVISDLERSDSKTWYGSVYNPKDGKTYSGRFTLLSDDALAIRAYIGWPIFGKGETWSRLDSDGGNGTDYACQSE
jgi:uncharacterized protein (DUF2147 family)